ncbi:site-specific tyrosine recombinase XerD [compost metagenome]
MVDGEEVISPKYTPYSLRHFFASMLIAEKTDIAKIKTLMGHTDISTTYDVYGHLIERSADEKGHSSGMIARMKNKPTKSKKGPR